MELLIQFLGQVYGVARIGKTCLAISGTYIIGETMTAFETDGFAIIEHSPDTFATEYLIALVGAFAGLFQKNFRFGSTHMFIYQINRTVYSLLSFESTAGYGIGKCHLRGQRRSGLLAI